MFLEHDSEVNIDFAHVLMCVHVCGVLYTPAHVLMCVHICGVLYTPDHILTCARMRACVSVCTKNSVGYLLSVLPVSQVV